jgi:hypothetical protein
MIQTRSCFIIMPFKAELNFLYLYLREYLERKHGLLCERGDHKVLTIPLIDKIRKHIVDADVIIADITDRNPNVFYELGLAEASGKKVVLITADPIKEAPTDIRHLDCIQYNLANHIEFLDRIDNAIHHVFAERYERMLGRARELLLEFNTYFHAEYAEATPEEFQRRMIHREKTQGTLDEADKADVVECLLPRIIQDSGDASTMRRIMEWLNTRYDKPS